MKKFLLFCLMAMTFLACKKTSEEPIVELQTTEGTLFIKLYKQTPKHRDNFVKLVNEGFFDGQLFYKAMKDFIIEAGDENTKDADNDHDRIYGAFDPEYTIPAEIRSPLLFHKKGALSAARQEDNINPTKKSSGTLFGIIIGQLYTSTQLDSLEKADYNHQLNITLQQVMIANRSLIDKTTQMGDEKRLGELQDSLIRVASKQMQLKKSKLLHFSATQRKIYTTIGGVPQMDGDYTVFGEVTKGLDVLDKINKLKVDGTQRPMKDVRILKATIVK